ncbi:S24 family peptidase [Paenibacillus hamazuiensis]|uniref:S24 family peptidase n=1 Tax=Paenibacillus hamazuiensis TaxID=2936508 RepID=UPI00200D0E83|nr:S24 family peptidase [Paenibacillus hamazuiensis]
MQTKIIPVVAEGRTKRFFSLSLDDADLSRAPHLQLPRVTEAQFALQLADEGLAGLGIRQGDYLLFGTTQPLRASGQIALIRQEDEYIIREAHWSGDTTLLRVPGDIYPELQLPTENIRIVAVLDNAMKDDEHVQIVHFH